MKNVFSLRKRSFLSPVSTGFTSHIFAEVESSNEENTGGVTICLPLPIAGAEFTRFRDVLAKEIALIEKAKAK